LLFWRLANIHPIQPYRYSPAAGPVEQLVTQPYDKISSEMQSRYLAQSPYNLVRIILGERFASDDENNNVYTRAAVYLEDWIQKGILARDAEPAFYAYFQMFSLPGSSEQFVRKGFIGLGPVEDYSAGIVHRHEQTLSGPKKDRSELLNHTRAHFGQIFMLYPDSELTVDRILDEASQCEPLATVTDEYGTVHRVWRIADAAPVAAIRQAMVDKKLLIADGHHRYETALAFRAANPQLKDAERVMMTFVNMHSPGLKILATHRIVSGLSDFHLDEFLSKVPTRALGSLAELEQVFAMPAPDRIRIGVAFAGRTEIHLIDRECRAGELDIRVLHEELLGKILRINEEAVRDEKHIRYVRGLDAAVSSQAQIAFLMEPTSIEQVADVAFGGGVMPQKSTDFYPKLLSGLTIYKLDE
jgi:uncharacterized protein (DUF1015 family)